MNQFTNLYRIVSKDVHVRKFTELDDGSVVIKECFVKHTIGFEQISEKERLVQVNATEFNVKQMKYKEVSNKKPYSNDKRDDAYLFALQRCFDRRIELSFVEETLLKAIEDFAVHRNYKYALLNAFTVTETAVSNFIREIKLKNGVSKKKLDDFKDEVGISYLLNVDLPFVLGNIDKHFEQLLGEVNHIRKIRNNVIHNGASVSYDDAKNSINTTMRLLMRIDNDKYALLCGDIGAIGNAKIIDFN